MPKYFANQLFVVECCYVPSDRIVKRLEPVV